MALKPVQDMEKVAQLLVVYLVAEQAAVHTVTVQTAQLPLVLMPLQTLVLAVPVAVLAVVVVNLITAGTGVRGFAYYGGYHRRKSCLFLTIGAQPRQRLHLTFPQTYSRQALPTRPAVRATKVSPV
jgi:hypothetical protein